MSGSLVNQMIALGGVVCLCLIGGLYHIAVTQRIKRNR